MASRLALRVGGGPSGVGEEREARVGGPAVGWHVACSSALSAFSG
jgi:hypothetical protein